MLLILGPTKKGKRTVFNDLDVAIEKKAACLMKVWALLLSNYLTIKLSMGFRFQDEGHPV